ncbi:MAG: hypothetical protein ABJE95_37990 [Byssovorax sp.]
MRPTSKLVLGALAALVLAGCDHGREPLAKGADAEALGNFAEAATQYRAVCDSGSSLCPIATRRIERIKLLEADKALSAGEYRKARAAITLALASADEGVKHAAEALSALPDLEQGLALEEALASAKPDDTLAAIEGVAAASVPVAVKAREWLEKNRPRILLDRIKAACSPQGVGACAERGRELARLHPTSPENAEATRLVEADYARLFPRLREAENLIGQQVILFERDRKIYWCMRDKANEADPDGSENPAVDKPSEVFRTPCEGEVPSEAIPTAAFLAKAWEKKLEEIHDPTFTKPLGERMARAAAEGLHDPEAWPKPAGTK